VGYVTQNYCWKETRGGGFTVKGKDNINYTNLNKFVKVVLISVNMFFVIKKEIIMIPNG